MTQNHLHLKVILLKISASRSFSLFNANDLQMQIICIKRFFDIFKGDPMRNILMVLLVVFLNPVLLFADEHEHENWPENTLLALEGSDAISKSECMLFVVDVQNVSASNSEFSAQVVTSYSHGDASPSSITVKPVAGKSNLLAGLGNNQADQIVMFLDNDNYDIQGVKSFNLKWLHGNHFHTNRCENMTIHTHAE